MKSVFFYFPLVIVSIAFGQVPEQIQRYRSDAQGDYKNRRQGIMDGNAIRTIFYNNGEVGQWPFAPSLEWPKGTGHQYWDGYCILLAAQITAPGNGQIIHPLETSYREEMAHDPVSGRIWGLEPIEGYANPAAKTPAMSNDKKSYPAAWPAALGVGPEWNGEWYGFFGKGMQAGALETFYVLDDSFDGKYKRAPYSFYPIAADSSRGGLGLRVEVHGIQFPDQPLQDVLIWDYKVTNLSDNDYDSTAFGIYLDPGVGGAGSANDDAAISRGYDLCYAWDHLGKGDPAYGVWMPGYVGLSIVHNPASIKGRNIAAFSMNPLNDKGPTGVWPKNNEVIWRKMTGGFVDTGITNSNMSVVIGGTLFKLPKWKSETIDVATIFGTSIDELVIKKFNAQVVCENRVSTLDSVLRFGSLRPAIKSPGANTPVSGAAAVAWDVAGAAGQAESYAYATNNSSYWKLLGSGSASGSAAWNTAAAPDGIFNTIGVIAYADNGIGFVQNDPFVTINNPGNAKPEIRLYGPKSQRTLQGITQITWRGGDADGDSCVVNVGYRLLPDSKWTPIASNVSAANGSCLWDTRTAPNSSLGLYELKAEIVSNADYGAVTAGGYSILNGPLVPPREPEIVSNRATGTGSLKLRVVDPTLVTSHPYLLTFSAKSDKSVTGNITDLATGVKKVTGMEPLDADHESVTFDGIRVIVSNDALEPDSVRSGFVNGTSRFPIHTEFDRTVPPLNNHFPYEYQLTFSNTVVDTTGDLDPITYPVLPVPFAVKNLSVNSEIIPLVQDMDGSNSFTKGDVLKIIDVVNGNMNMMLSVTFGSSRSAEPLPTLGDVYVIRMKKPFVVGDSIVFTTSGTVNVENTPALAPNEYALSQNYPNPFNPSTTIQFSLPVPHAVTLKVYDILGKEVATLVQERLQAGNYSVKYDASALSSGMYFYRLTAGEFSSVKKFMFVK